MGDVDTAAYWWWETDEGTRAVILTADRIGVTGSLSRSGLADVEAARLRGDPFDADLGRLGVAISLDDVVELRLARDESTLELLMADGVTSLGIRPPAWSIAAGVFEEIRRRRSPDAPVRSAMVAAPDGSDLARWISPAITRIMAATGGLGLMLALFADLEADADPADGLVGSVRTGIEDVFASVGAVPAIICFVITLVLAIARLYGERAAARHAAQTRHEIRVEIPARPTFAVPVTAVEDVPPDALRLEVMDPDVDPLADLLEAVE